MGLGQTARMGPDKEAEEAYFRRIPDEALAQAVGKPFSVADRGRLLVEFGVVLAFLPEPPARVLDFGCGTGWTSAFLARSGYEVVGLDLSPEAVAAAGEAFPLPNLRFVAHDFDEAVPDELGRFDAAVFFDTLHHAEDERRPLAAAREALKVGGVCVACEPGTGHAASVSSLHAVRTFGVRERDMTPAQIVTAARVVGFARATVHPHPHEIFRHLYQPRTGTELRDRLLATPVGEAVQLVRAATVGRTRWGLVVLTR